MGCHWRAFHLHREDGFDRDSAEGWEDLQIHVTDVFDDGGDGGGGDGMEGVLVAVIVVLLLVIVGLLVRMHSMRG